MSDRTPRQLALVTTVIHLAFMASPAIYGLVAWLLVREAAGRARPQGFGLLAGILGLVAAATVSVSFVLPGVMASERRLAAAMRSPGGSGKGLFAEGGPLHGSPGLVRGLRLAFAAWIVRLALLEAVAIYGLVLTLMSRELHWIAGFGGAAFLLMAPARFDPDPVERLHERSSGSTA